MNSNKLKLANVLGFDIYCGRTLIGFILVRKYLDNAFFLLDYAIDHKYQNSGYGFTALCEFISFMQRRVWHEHNDNNIYLRQWTRKTHI